MKRSRLGVLALAVAIATAACGSSSTSSTTVKTAGAGACGSVPQRLPADPDGVLAKLPSKTQAAYDLYPQAVHVSAWAKWKPNHKPPYTVYLGAGDTNTPFIQGMLTTFNALKAKSGGLVGKLITQDAGNSVQTQIQQMQQAIQNKVDLIVVWPGSQAAEAPTIEAAGKAGIPVIEPVNAAANRYAIGVDGNTILAGAKLAQGLVSAIGHKGNVLGVHGFPGTPSDFQLFQGANEVLKRCPDVKTVGSVSGEFTPAVAKSGTLQFLASHPQQISGAIQAGGMATGIIQAFAQTGRKVPTVADQGATPGALAYWKQHQDTYKGVALPLPPATIATAVWDLATGLLQGRGVKITDVLDAPVLITRDNLAQWVQPGWTEQTALAFAPTPASVQHYASSYLDQFFSAPAPKG